LDTNIVMPQLGVEIEEALVEEWTKAEGESVNEGELIVLVTTPKLTMEIEAPAAGVLKSILVPAQEIAKVGAVLGVIEAR
jgi:pyruvate dehydrogenase E2 component (dihydrolipoamide acetyltransferase)